MGLAGCGSVSIGRGARIADEFKGIVEEYIESRYAKGLPPGERVKAAG